MKWSRDMKFICIMGRAGSGKSTVEKALEQMGFTRSISYTSREPQFRDGKQEQHGNEYMFVSRDKFLELVDKGQIIEYEEYNGNLYGTPRPFGAQRYVAVVCVGGFKALKQLYGDQVTGVYLSVSEETAALRGEKRDGSANIVKERKKQDEFLLKEMKEVADVVVDANRDLNNVLADILKAVRRD